MKRNGKVSEAIESVKKEMAYQRKSWKFIRQFAAEIDEDLLPENARIALSAGSIYIHIPWGKETLSQLRKAMGPEWRFTSKYENQSGAMTRYYGRKVFYGEGSWDYDSYSLMVTMDPDVLPEGTCRKILVEEKEEMVIRKIYKVICDDGVEDMETVEDVIS